jgi:hypothetical protein
MGRGRQKTATSICPTASTRACSSSRHRDVIGIASTFAIAQQACLICGRKQSDPHHLRYLQPRALGRKASDEFAVPLCRAHHRAVHRASDEQAWWKGAGVDPVNVARQLWQETRNHPQDGHPVALRRARASAMLDAPLSSCAARCWRSAVRLARAVRKQWAVVSLPINACFQPHYRATTNAALPCST